MDSKFFRLPSYPNLYPPTDAVKAVDVRTKTRPAPNSRFPGWPAPMSDARLVTDYSPHCSQNVPSNRQFPTKQWMQKDSDRIIEYGRVRAAESMGGMFSYDDSVVPPPVDYVQCKKSGCQRVAVEGSGGIGTERMDRAPELFGTYSIPNSSIDLPTNTSFTTYFEGGRNSKRG